MLRLKRNPRLKPFKMRWNFIAMERTQIFFSTANSCSFGSSRVQICKCKLIWIEYICIRKHTHLFYLNHLLCIFLGNSIFSELFHAFIHSNGVTRNVLPQVRNSFLVAIVVVYIYCASIWKCSIKSIFVSQTMANDEHKNIHLKFQSKITCT